MNNKGFVAAEFIFTFVLVISCGLIVFALTFSLMTIEVSQYITWSAARAYSSGNLTKIANQDAGRTKFANLSSVFPLLTKGSWFSLSMEPYGVPQLQNIDPKNSMVTGAGEPRHPWLGVNSKIELKLFKSLQVPFLGPITKDETLFDFQLHAFIFRNPSQRECLDFIETKFNSIKSLPDFSSLPSSNRYKDFAHEDNGC